MDVQSLIKWHYLLRNKLLRIKNKFISVINYNIEMQILEYPNPWFPSNDKRDGWGILHLQTGNRN